MTSMGNSGLLTIIQHRAFPGLPPPRFLGPVLRPARDLHMVEQEVLDETFRDTPSSEPYEAEAWS